MPRFKTHSDRNGDLMFAVFADESALFAAIDKAANDALFNDRVHVLVEDGKGWRTIARSGWLVDHPSKGTQLIPIHRVRRWLGVAPVRWSLFSDDDPLTRTLSRSFFAPRRFIENPIEFDGL